jgi:type IV secretion system coupling TraD/TrwB family protein
MGDLTTWRRGNWVGFPAHNLGEHTICVGSSGSGKTETLLRIAYGARKVYGRQIIFIDAKGDERKETAARFVAAMHEAGATRVRMFPATYYDGWKGSSVDLFNRLISVIDYSESRFYGDVAADVLRLALEAPTGVPRSSQQLLNNMTLKRLMEIYKGTPQVTTIAGLDRKLLNQVLMRYRVFFGAMREQLDGTLGYEDADAVYAMINGFTLRDEAPRLGRFLTLDFAHYVANRKPLGVSALLIIDEFNALRMREEASILFEQARSFGASLVISSQSYAGLGRREDAERILGAANTYILHRCSDPEEIAKRAGRQPRIRSHWGVELGKATSRARMQVYDDWKVHPDVVRQQGRGEAFLINGGRAQQLRLAQVPLTSSAIAEAKRLIEQEETTQQTLLATAQQVYAQQSQASTPSRSGSPVKSTQQRANPKRATPSSSSPGRRQAPQTSQQMKNASNTNGQDDDDDAADRIS